MSTTVTVEQIPPTLKIDDVCRVLSISRRQFYRRQRWLREMGILVEVVPRLDSVPRFQGAAIARFLGAEGQADHTRRALRRVR